MLKELLDETKPRIHALVETKSWRQLAELVGNWPEPEIADLLYELEREERVLLFRSLPRPLAAEVFSHLEADLQNQLITDLTGEDTRHLLANLTPDDRTALLAELPAAVTQKLLHLLNSTDLKEARQLLGYPEDSVGRLMTPDYISIRPTWSVGQALDHIRQSGQDRETFNQIYVTNEKGHLIDALRLRKLILANPSQLVESICDHTFISLTAFEDREAAVQKIQRYDIYALPVVDSEGAMLGIVTMDDVLDVAEEEATEDIQKGAAVSPLDTPYSMAGIPLLFQRRIGWLVTLIFVNLFSAAIIGHHEENLQAFIVLAFFMPLLIASGGNTGAQSATLMVRAIATADLELGDWWRAMRKELLVGIFLGLAMGALTYFLGLYRGGMEIGLVVGLTMLAVVVVANLLGVLMPFALKMVRMDPAVASSPLITSIMDAVGLLIYFGIASAILKFH